MAPPTQTRYIQFMAFDISEEQIAKTESTLGRGLPPIYRTMMGKNNGGTAFDDEDQWDLHPIKDDSDRKRLSRSCNHIIAETKSAQAWRGFPSEGLAVGNNGSGDIMLLLPSETDATLYADRLFVYWHETGKVEPFADDLASFEIE